MRAAESAGDATQPVAVRAAILLCETLQANYATLTVLQETDSTRYSITRGRGLDQRPSRPWQANPSHAPSSPHPSSIRVEVEALRTDAAGILTPGQPVIGATSSYHTLLYAAGSSTPLGRLSLYASQDLSLTASRVALIHAVAARLGQELAGEPLIEHAPT
jgi:hypothetical protein